MSTFTVGQAVRAPARDPLALSAAARGLAELGFEAPQLPACPGIVTAISPGAPWGMADVLTVDFGAGGRVKCLAAELAPAQAPPLDLVALAAAGGSGPAVVSPALAAALAPRYWAQHGPPRVPPC